ncbi:MAG: ABC transporter permease [Gammaproteobacteria bacterium]|nr:ABC transporter permease [Gammaproteobacteria bacterium]
MNTELLAQTLPKLLEGVPDTLTLVTAALALGFVLAVVVASARLSSSSALAALAGGYVYVFRGTPLLVQIYLIYYGSGQFRAELQQIGLWTAFREPYFCAIAALTLNTAAYTSEIIRGGILSVPIGQLEAAKAVGMSRFAMFKRITFPIAIRQALPAYSNEIILMVKASSLASTITILEVTGLAKKIIASTFQPIEVFIVAGAIYLAINFVITRMVGFAERRLSPQRSSHGKSIAPVATH